MANKTNKTVGVGRFSLLLYADFLILCEGLKFCTLKHSYMQI